MSFDQPLNCIATFASHASWVYGIAITPDNKKIATISFDKILVWDLETHTLINILESHSDIIFSLKMSPDGKILASGSNDKTVKLWDFDSGEVLYTLAAKKDPIHSVSFSPDGNILASGGANKYKSERGKTTTIYLWDLYTRELISSLSDHTQRINQLVFSCKGDILVSNSNDETIKIWNPYTGELLHTIETTSSSIAITPDGKNLINVGDSGIQIWNIDERTLLRTISDDSAFVKTCAISPNGQLLASSSYNQINIHQIDSGKFLQSLEFSCPIITAFSPDGRLLASGDATCFSQEEGGLVKVWELPEDELPEEKDIIDELKLLQKDDANPANIEDARKRVITSIVQRQGQGKFRKQLLEAYEYRCCITGYDAEIALEAAHIIPYNGVETNYVSNGLLLRADLHTLFDLHQISIHPDTGMIVIARQLYDTCYATELAGKCLRKPRELLAQPHKEAINQHYKKFCVYS